MKIVFYYPLISYQNLPNAFPPFKVILLYLFGLPNGIFLSCRVYFFGMFSMSPLCIQVIKT